MRLLPEILVVDDEPLVRSTLAEILQVGGLSVTTAGRAMETISKIRRQFFNLVLLDLNLPDMNGLELVDHIKHYSPKTEVVIITGFATLETAVEAMERGVMAYVEKPVQPNQLLTTVNGVLEKQRLRLDNERMLRQLSALLYFAQDITSELKLGELLRRIVVRATELTDGEKGFVALLEDEILRMDEYWDGQQWVKSQAQWAIGVGIPGQVWSTQQPQLCPDPGEEPSVESAMGPQFGQGSCVSAPIIDTAGQFIGVLEVGNRNGGEPFSQEDLSMLQALSRQAAVAIENARLYERQKEEAEISQSLLCVAESLSQFTDLDELLGIASEIIPGLIGCDQFGLLLLERGRNRFCGATARGRSKAEERQFLALKCEVGKSPVLDEVLKTREPLVIEDVARSRYFSPSLIQRFNLTSCLLVPLLAKGEVIGLMGLNDPAGPRSFSRRDIRVAVGVANQLAIAIDNTQLFSEVSTHKRALQRLSMRLTKVLEEERARISRELHDGLGQVLSGMSIGLDVLEEKVPSSLVSVKQGLSQIKMLTEKTLDELRRMSHDLRPSLLDDLGLLDALQWLVDYLTERCGWAAQVVVEPDFPRLPPEVETALFRISQEALNNIKTHANASTVKLRLSSQGGTVKLEIEDNGSGFDPVDRAADEFRGRGIGLLSMQERATAVGGRFFIESETGKGTKITVTIPHVDEPPSQSPTALDEAPNFLEGRR